MKIEITQSGIFWTKSQAIALETGPHEIPNKSFYDEGELSPYDASLLVRAGRAKFIH